MMIPRSRHGSSAQTPRSCGKNVAVEELGIRAENTDSLYDEEPDSTAQPQLVIIWVAEYTRPVGSKRSNQSYSTTLRQSHFFGGLSYFSFQILQTRDPIVSN
jgi:hypothetical protein